MEQEESIDLGKLIQIALSRKKAISGLIIGCTALAIIFSYTLPEEWESTTLVQTRSTGQNLGGAAAMAAAMGINIGGGSSGSPLNYIELMKNYSELMIKYPDIKVRAEKDLEYIKSANIAKIIAMSGCKNCIEIVSNKLDVNEDDLCEECKKILTNQKLL